jgi:hypothetical protein
MDTKTAIKSKTINFNVILLAVISIMAGFGIDVPDGIYQALLAGIPLGNIILRFLTKGTITLTRGDSQSGKIKPFLMVLCVCIAVMFSAGIGLMGCAGTQTATQQISSQTSDPKTIALAAYADAQDLYIAAVEIYLPYQATIIKTDPGLNDEIIHYFREANKILDDWGTLGGVSDAEKAGFTDYIRQITLLVAR